MSKLLAKFYSKNPFIIRLLNWEYWPSQAFYFPLIPYFIYLAIRSRHACFFTAVNPGIEAGGIGIESKFKTIENIPKTYCPKTIIAKANIPFENLAQQLRSAEINFPVIAKPDIGFRGLLVKKINSSNTLKDYLSRYNIDFIIQEFVSYPTEVGVMYYRFPYEQSCHITSLTLKEFLHVRGDGRSSVEQLISDHPRAHLQLQRIQKTFPNLLNSIPKKNEKVNLGVIGNHSKGTRFINGNHLIDKELIKVFDHIGKQIQGFNYGRFDIKCKSLDDLKKGQNFKIIEVNGVCSEPTHIYDPEGSTYFKSVQDIKKHWGVVQKIGVLQHQLGKAYWKPLKMMKALWHLRAYTRNIQKLSRDLIKP